jgi:hypothetical protein
MNPIPPRMRVAMKYTDVISLTSSAGAARLTGSQWEFRLNSLYDPDKSGSGHQPYMYDQFAALYGRYRVDRVDIQIEAIASPATSHCITALVQGPSGGWDISGQATSSLIENVKCKNVNVLTTAVTPPKIRMSVDIPTFLGITKHAYDADLSVWGAVMGANPSRTCFLNVATSVYAGTSESIQVAVTLVFHADLWDPVVFGQS